jgi:hypothetical protein
MTEQDVRDTITVQDEQGKDREFAVEALFDMNEESYALLKSEEDIVLMRVEGDDEEGQYLVGIDDAEEAHSILAAYEIAVEAAPAE